MNVLVALIGVILMQLATTLKEVTPALATVDTRAMGFLATVSSSISNHNRYCYQPDILCTNIQTLMSASTTMEVVSTLAMTWMEVTHVPAIMDTCLLVMDKRVKVGIY